MDNFGILLDARYTHKVLYLAEYMEKTPDSVIFDAIDTMWDELQRSAEDG